MTAPPIRIFKVGGVSFSVWENEEGVSIKFDGRTYKDKDGKWQQTNYLNRNDIVKLKIAVDDLMRWAFTENIFKNRFKKDEEKAEETPSEFKTASEYLEREKRHEDEY